MAEGALSIKLRCASWHQLATIYKRDLSHGTMFLRAAAPPPIGTAVRIDLTLPSATVIALDGVIAAHVQDPQRGSGIEITLSPIPASSVWLIESALASEARRRATPARGVPVIVIPPISGALPTFEAAPVGPTTGSRSINTSFPTSIGTLVPAIHDHADVAVAEQDLIKALVSEAESLKKLNPFLVLGVGYEAGDAEVRAAFGELTKRYHPDRFARYESIELRQLAAEIFILIRDAYRRLGDAAGRAQVLQSLGTSAPPPRVVPAPGRRSPSSTPPRATPRVSIPPAASPPPRTAPAGSSPPPGVPGTPVAPMLPTVTVPVELAALEHLVDQGRLDEALAGYRMLARRHAHDRNARAGAELCEGLLALAARDRPLAAQRFETALEIDPSNERAARELAEMRRQATNERKGLLSRLMGKKEP